MGRRITILVASVLAIIAFAAGIAALTSQDQVGACTLDARPDAPEGWAWSRDGGNDCAWTLYDANGNTAPAEIYEAAGEDPPPSSFDLTAPVAFAVGVVATIVAVATARRSRREGESEI